MKVLGGDYVYTIKDSAGNEVTEQTQIAAGLYTVTAVLDTETKTTTVTYRVAVGKTLEDAEGEDISLTFEEATYAKMTVLGSDYVYTVTDSQGNTVTEGTALAAGVYTGKSSEGNGNANSHRNLYRNDRAAGGSRGSLRRSYPTARRSG